MKQGIKALMPVRIGIDLDEVERIEFKVVQGETELFFEYPSERTIRQENDNVIDVIWERAETYMFKAGEICSLDTRITLIDNDYNPSTAISTFVFSPTLFKENE